jgi:hypothetical protein
MSIVFWIGLTIVGLPIFGISLYALSFIFCEFRRWVTVLWQCWSVWNWDERSKHILPFLFMMLLIGMLITAVGLALSIPSPHRIQTTTEVENR